MNATNLKLYQKKQSSIKEEITLQNRRHLSISQRRRKEKTIWKTQTKLSTNFQ